MFLGKILKPNKIEFQKRKSVFYQKRVDPPSTQVLKIKFNSLKPGISGLWTSLPLLSGKITDLTRLLLWKASLGFKKIVATAK
jgi:hypothetical protein